MLRTVGAGRWNGKMVSPSRSVSTENSTEIFSLVSNSPLVSPFLCIPYTFP